MKNLKINNEKLRDLYLRDLSLGYLQGPPTGKPSIDKKWLKFYSGEQILDSFVPDETIFNYMMKENLNHLDDVALYYFGKKITYRELRRQIFRFASSIASCGIKKGDNVTMCMPNTPEAVVAFYGLNMIGVVINPIHPLSSENEIKDFINETNSRLLLAIDSSLDKINSIKYDTNLEKTIVVSPADSMPMMLKTMYKLKSRVNDKCLYDENTIKFSDFIDNYANFEKVKVNSYTKDEAAVMLRTGGTTGKSKGVVLTNENFNSMVQQFKQNADNFERGDKMLSIMPVFHGFGLCSSIHLPLSLGVGCILIPKLSVKKIDKIFDKYHPNHILGVPTLFKGIIENENMKDKDLSYVKNIVSGGDLVKDSLEDTVNEFFSEHNSSVKLSKGYGLSEAVAGVTFATKNYNSYNSIGIPMINTNIKIINQETQEEVMEDEVGEICIKGPSVMKEYYKHKNETKESIKDGWLHTGDLGYYHDSMLYFSTRKGNMIISSGVNVYPSEIESVIEQHEAVAACAVAGVSHPYKIEVPKAYVILNEGYEANDNLKNEIEALCKKNLNKYSVPYSYEFMEKLPKTLLGKISYKDLKEESLTSTKVFVKK